MEKIHVYVTKDRKQFDTMEKATDHCLEMAHNLLTHLLRTATNVENPYEVARRIIDSKGTINAFNAINSWLCDVHCLGLNEED